MKTGRLSKQEWDYIERNADLMTPEQIAVSLKRDITAIKTYLIKLGKNLSKHEDIQTHVQYDLRSRPYWKELESQFTAVELDLFAYHWSRYVAQFNMDVTASEEVQILDMCKMEVLSNRALTEQRQCMVRAEELEIELSVLKRIPKMAIEDIAEHRDQIFNFEKQISYLRTAREALSRDYKELQDKKSRLFKDTKATRDQRFDRVESHKRTFASLIEDLLKNPQFREECSLDMEKMRLAIQEEKKRLAEYHDFGNGEIERCLLTSETVNQE